ncbi:hypothetical protein NQ318_021248 [Aromia moschata]|uniref:snRNA-activating protein complex subunit 3 n=1 Tax=Aromia moschata TaxID=1265417 RepID=A0AAV8ZBF1_9CUCU|nr:hypothetical protein NQ318_021248 [Aromia moschata]
MEKIYDPKCFRASDHIPIKEYFEEYSKVCDTSNKKCKSKKKKCSSGTKILQEMGINLSAREFREMENICSLDKLTIADEPSTMPANVPEKIQTKTKLDYVYPVKSSGRKLNVVKCKQILEKMYRPYSISYGQKNSGEKMRFAYEIEALGTNTLSQVADTIVCRANIGLYKEVPNTDVDLGALMNAKEHYPSQSIFIDGIFYNDTRSPNAIDYSVKIIEWAHEKNIGKFKSEIMERTVLNSLTPRLGYPYVYMHQGNCEHIFTFSDARLIQVSDCLSSKKYPRIVSLSRATNIMCYICGVSHSQWIIMKCSKFPQEKVFLCTACCNSYLFVDGEKVVDFNLYPYYDEELMTRHLNGTDVEGLVAAVL